MTQALVRRIRPLSRLALACAVALGAIAAQAAGDGGGGSGSSDGSSTPAPEVTKAVAAIKAERWNDAIAVLAPYVKRVRNDADAYNWLAYAYRKSGKLEPAFENYKRALSVQPGHLGAHEYIGEAYLMAGQPDKADYHLRELERLCGGTCEQYQDLRQAIVAYRGGRSVGAAKP